MTTTKSTPTERVDTPVMGFKNPTNWAIAAAAGPAAAAVLVVGLTFIPTWAVYTIVAGVSIWLFFQALDWCKNRPSSEDEQDAEPVMESADVA